MSASVSHKTALPLLHESPTVSSVATKTLSLRSTTSLAIALLLMIAAIAAYGICDVVSEASLQTQYVAWSVCGMLVLLAIVILLLGRLITHRSLRIIEQRLHHLTKDDELANLDAPVPGELQPVLSALSGYVTKVRTRVDQLRMQKKELDIQMRVADAERQNTEAIIFSISDAVLVIDSFGELILANTAAERLFGFRSAAWRHRPIERVLDEGSLISLIKDARTAGDRSIRRQVEYSTLRNGRTQTFNITLSTVVDANGQSRGVVAVFHDITREREIAQVKTDFVSSVSHELRTPLSSIKAYVEMLVDGEAHDENTRRHFYEIIQTETDRLQRLISNILNISRIESGVVDIHRESIPANTVVETVTDMMLPQAREKNIELTCELGENVPAVWADRDLLHQAVLNVISNAVKYTQPGGLVRVSTHVETENRHVAISISDNGMGIRAQDLSRVFDKFYRAPDGAAIAKGTGLGLNLVKHIVETVHGGQISVASELNSGTTMVLRFPYLAD
ncbi:MAG: cell wall metabolism sensor histidine kinase WalK [Phycisphaerae bacterium]|nr:cell wall metabolism sensor histidine kinase WalK [Phycisphaerae bacterium]